LCRHLFEVDQRRRKRGVILKPRQRRNLRARSGDTKHVRWSLEVRTRDGWRCVRCGKDYSGKRGSLQAAHIYGKGAYAHLRYVVDNGVSLDYYCHNWAHEHPQDFVDLVKERIGEAAYARLTEAAKLGR
jgi:hypothetical protein